MNVYRMQNECYHWHERECPTQEEMDKIEDFDNPCFTCPFWRKRRDDIEDETIWYEMDL